MNSAAWTSFCDCTEKSYNNLIQCFDCSARNSQISYSVFSFISVSVSIQTEIVDLSINSSSCTQVAVSVSVSKFSVYNCEQGTETLYQAYFTQYSASVQDKYCQISVSSLLTSQSYHAFVTFSLLQYKLVNDLAHTLSFQALDTYNKISELLSS